MAEISGYLNVIKNAASGELVRNAIIDCMREINEDGPLKKASLVITSDRNTTYKPGKGKAFTSVTVNIDSSGESDPSKTYTYEPCRVTSPENTTIYPPENTMFNSVEVAIEYENETSAHLAEEGHMTYYNVDESTGQKYWDANSVGSGVDYVKRVWIDTDIPGLNQGGSTGGSGSGKGPWTVTFLNASGGTVCGTVSDIPNGGSVNDGNGNIPNIIEVTGRQGGVWSGSVNAVYSNMTVFPTFPKTQGSGTIPFWDDILKDCGASAEIGATCEYTPEGREHLTSKIIFSEARYDYSSDPRTLVHMTFDAGDFALPSMTFMKVASGEAGTTSTWLSTEPLTLVGYNQTGMIYLPTNSTGQTSGGSENPGDEDYRTSLFANFINFRVAAMFDERTRAKIQPVRKWQFGYSNTDVASGDVADMGYKTQLTDDKFSVWIPSMGELYGLVDTACANRSCSDHSAKDDDTNFFAKETNSIDYYAAGWRPSRLAVGTRDMILTRSSSWEKEFGAWPHLKAIYCKALDAQNYPNKSDIEITTELYGDYIIPRALTQDRAVIYIGFCLG